MKPSEIRRVVQRMLKALGHVLKAIVHCQAARAMTDDLPERADDRDGHDSQVETLHGVVRMARSALETHFGRSLRRGSGSGTSASGTDDNLPYDVGGDELGRAKEQIRNADAEADKIVDAIGDDAAVDAAANDMHDALRQADLHLENYRAAVIDNPEGKARRARARAIAAATVQIIDPVGRRRPSNGAA
jgi:hypothetical protein